MQLFHWLEDMHSIISSALVELMQGRHGSGADTPAPYISCIGLRHLVACHPHDWVMQGRHGSGADTPAPYISCIGMRPAFSSLSSTRLSNAREAWIRCWYTGAIHLLGHAFSSLPSIGCSNAVVTYWTGNSAVYSIVCSCKQQNQHQPQ